MIIGVGERCNTKCTMNFGTHNGIFHCDEDVVSYNQTHNYNVRFVIFPYPAGGWAAQSVPPSIEKKFEQLVSFPKEWAGGNEQTLPVISGIQDATFCHNGCFFARAKTKESVLEMCRIAMK